MHYEVRFTVKLPEGIAATQKEAEDWLRFYLHDNGSLAGANPLIDHEPKPLPGTFRIFPTMGYATTPTYQPRLTPVGAGDGNTFVVG